MLRVIILTICVWCLASAAWAQNQISSVRAAPSGDRTRLVLDLKSAPEYTYFSLENPYRLVIDLGLVSIRIAVVTAQGGVEVK